VAVELTDEQWQELLTADAPLRKRWEAQVDVIAGYLKQLRDARIPVLWRPYHEANGDWFWWGGRGGENGYIALYRMTYDRLVHYHHLDNLIWVWNMNAPNGKNAGPYADYFPGAWRCAGRRHLRGVQTEFYVIWRHLAAADCPRRSGRRSHSCYS
jgi:mannan endo-1,4-beta-mannosidase